MEKIEPEIERDIPIGVEDQLRKYSLEEIWEAYVESKKSRKGSRFLETPHDLRGDEERIKVTIPFFLIHTLDSIRKKTFNSMRLATCLITKVGVINLDQIVDSSLSTTIKQLIDTKETLREINTYFNLEDHVILARLERRDPLWRYFLQVRRRNITVYSWVAGRISNFASTLGLTMDDATRIVLCVGLSKSSTSIPPTYIKKIYNYLDYLNNVLSQENDELEKNTIKYLFSDIESDLITATMPNLKQKEFLFSLGQRDSSAHNYTKYSKGGYGGIKANIPAESKLQDLVQKLKTENKTPLLRENLEKVLTSVKQLKTAQEVFELEKQLPTQSLSEETVRAEYRFFNHNPKYTEIRAINPSQARNKVIQLVSNEDDFLEYVKAFDGKWQVYLGINRRYQPGSGEMGAGTMEDVDQVGAIAVDIDCKRANKKEPASDLELDAAFAVANRITVDFITRGFRAPVRVMSGNGWQLRWAIPPIELNDSNRREVNWKLQEFQRFVKANYENEFVEIDNIGDVPRIIKVCGTKSIKGAHSVERPHRYSYALDSIVREEDTRLREFILSFEKPKRELREGELPKWRGSLDFDKLVEKDEKLSDLYAGRWQRFGYKSRSEAELALVCKLIYYGFSKREIWSIMDRSGIGKWGEKAEGYKELTYAKALEFAR